MKVKGTKPTLCAVCSKCQRLDALYAKQKAGKLGREKWLLATRVLLSAGHVALAREFSTLSPAHDAARERKIDAMAMLETLKDVTCRDLGCDLGKSLLCFKQKKGLREPSAKLALDMRQKEEIGLFFNEDGDRLQGFDSERFVSFFLENYELRVEITPKECLFHLYSGHIWQQINEPDLTRLLWHFFRRFSTTGWSINVQQRCLDLLTKTCRRVDSLKSPRDYINVRNGLLNIRTHELEPHDKRIWTVFQVPVNYNPSAKCPRFLQFLREVFWKDKEMVQLVQEVTGYCVTYSTDADRFFLFWGGGANGKSVYCNTLIALVGGMENISCVSLRDLQNKFSVSQIQGNVLNVATENEVSKAVDSQMLKNITSGEAVQIEKKYLHPTTDRLYAKLVFNTNNAPKFNDPSYGLGRRFVILPFTRRFVEQPRNGQDGKIDPYLKEKLLKELEGIFAFAMVGLKRLVENNFQFSPAKMSQKALQRFNREAKPCLDFLLYCIFSSEPEEKILNREAYWMFRAWARKKGYDELLSMTYRIFLRQFKEALDSEEFGLSYRASGGPRYFYGIALNEAGVKLKRSRFYINEDESKALKQKEVTRMR